jgi:hypothetical protein
VSDETRPRRTSSKRSRALSPGAIEVARQWDVLPLVAQQYVLDLMATLRQLEHEHAQIARLLWARADPKRVKLHERKIERYQATHRGRRK